MKYWVKVFFIISMFILNINFSYAQTRGFFDNFLEELEEAVTEIFEDENDDEDEKEENSSNPPSLPNPSSIVSGLTGGNVTTINGQTNVPIPDYNNLTEEDVVNIIVEQVGENPTYTIPGYGDITIITDSPDGPGFQVTPEGENVSCSTNISGSKSCTFTPLIIVSGNTVYSAAEGRLEVGKNNNSREVRIDSKEALIQNLSGNTQIIKSETDLGNASIIITSESESSNTTFNPSDPSSISNLGDSDRVNIQVNSSRLIHSVVNPENQSEMGVKFQAEGGANTNIGISNNENGSTLMVSGELVNGFEYDSEAGFKNDENLMVNSNTSTTYNLEIASDRLGQSLSFNLEAQGLTDDGQPSQVQIVDNRSVNSTRTMQTTGATRISINGSGNSLNSSSPNFIEANAQIESEQIVFSDRSPRGQSSIVIRQTNTQISTNNLTGENSTNITAGAIEAETDKGKGGKLSLNGNVSLQGQENKDQTLISTSSDLASISYGPNEINLSGNTYGSYLNIKNLENKSGNEIKSQMVVRADQGEIRTPEGRVTVSDNLYLENKTLVNGDTSSIIAGNSGSIVGTSGSVSANDNFSLVTHKSANGKEGFDLIAGNVGYTGKDNVSGSGTEIKVSTSQSQDVKDILFSSNSAIVENEKIKVITNGALASAMSSGNIRQGQISSDFISVTNKGTPKNFSLVGGSLFFYEDKSSKDPSLFLAGDGEKINYNDSSMVLEMEAVGKDGTKGKFNYVYQEVEGVNTLQIFGQDGKRVFITGKNKDSNFGDVLFSAASFYDDGKIKSGSIQNFTYSNTSEINGKNTSLIMNAASLSGVVSNDGSYTEYKLDNGKLEIEEQGGVIGQLSAQDGVYIKTQDLTGDFEYVSLTNSELLVPSSIIGDYQGNLNSSLVTSINNRFHSGDSYSERRVQDLNLNLNNANDSINLGARNGISIESNQAGTNSNYVELQSVGLDGSQSDINYKSFLDSLVMFDTVSSNGDFLKQVNVDGNVSISDNTRSLSFDGLLGVEQSNDQSQFQFNGRSLNIENGSEQSATGKDIKAQGVQNDELSWVQLEFGSFTLKDNNFGFNDKVVLNSVTMNLREDRSDPNSINRSASLSGTSVSGEKSDMIFSITTPDTGEHFNIVLSEVGGEKRATVFTEEGSLVKLDGSKENEKFTLLTNTIDVLRTDEMVGFLMKDTTLSHSTKFEDSTGNLSTVNNIVSFNRAEGFRLNDGSQAAIEFSGVFASQENTNQGESLTFSSSDGHVLMGQSETGQEVQNINLNNLAASQINGSTETSTTMGRVGVSLSGNNNVSAEIDNFVLKSKEDNSSLNLDIGKVGLSTDGETSTLKLEDGHSLEGVTSHGFKAIPGTGNGLVQISDRVKVSNFNIEGQDNSEKTYVKIDFEGFNFQQGHRGDNNGVDKDIVFNHGVIIYQRDKESGESSGKLTTESLTYNASDYLVNATVTDQSGNKRDVNVFYFDDEMGRRIEAYDENGNYIDLSTTNESGMYGVISGKKIAHYFNDEFKELLVEETAGKITTPPSDPDDDIVLSTIEAARFKRGKRNDGSFTFYSVDSGKFETSNLSHRMIANGNFESLMVGRDKKELENGSFEEKNSLEVTNGSLNLKQYSEESSNAPKVVIIDGEKFVEYLDQGGSVKRVAVPETGYHLDDQDLLEKMINEEFIIPSNPEAQIQADTNERRSQYISSLDEMKDVLKNEDFVVEGNVKFGKLLSSKTTIDGENVMSFFQVEDLSLGVVDTKKNQSLEGQIGEIYSYSDDRTSVINIKDLEGLNVRDFNERITASFRGKEFLRVEESDENGKVVNNYMLIKDADLKIKKEGLVKGDIKADINSLETQNGIILDADFNLRVKVELDVSESPKVGKYLDPLNIINVPVTELNLALKGKNISTSSTSYKDESRGISGGTAAINATELQKLNAEIKLGFIPLAKVEAKGSNGKSIDYAYQINKENGTVQFKVTYKGGDKIEHQFFTLKLKSKKKDGDAISEFYAQVYGENPEHLMEIVSELTSIKRYNKYLGLSEGGAVNLSIPTWPRSKLMLELGAHFPKMDLSDPIGNPSLPIPARSYTVGLSYNTDKGSKFTFKGGVVASSFIEFSPESDVYTLWGEKVDTIAATPALGVSYQGPNDVHSFSAWATMPVTSAFVEKDLLKRDSVYLSNGRKHNTGPGASLAYTYDPDKNYRVRVVAGVTDIGEVNKEIHAKLVFERDFNLETIFLDPFFKGKPKTPKYRKIEQKHRSNYGAKRNDVFKVQAEKMSTVYHFIEKLEEKYAGNKNYVKILDVLERAKDYIENPPSPGKDLHNIDLFKYKIIDRAKFLEMAHDPEDVKLLDTIIFGIQENRVLLSNAFANEKSRQYILKYYQDRRNRDWAKSLQFLEENSLELINYDPCEHIP